MTIGWLSLVPDAEDLARDIDGGDDWHESVILPPIPGTFTYSADYKVESGIDALTGQVLYQDLPFTLTSQEPGGPPYVYNIDRRGQQLDGTEPSYYALADADMQARFEDKRRKLQTAASRLTALPGYSITAETTATENLQKAQLLLAIIDLRGSGNAFYAMLLAGGVKRKRASKSEIEMFAPGELGDVAGLQGVCSEVLNLIEQYKIAACYGGQLEA